ncbi:unnamed protein product [Ambrosiozyma monospora]|uniref:Unnamed protein product n=1 Tax=Ambrosiozyma monospora TaxID=43982 RepID=A0ACB5TRI6_AMBMO|nr:unnamed protein product [Ambrosiozyma monospora]
MNMNMMNGMTGSASVNSRLSSAIGSPMSPRFVSPESISSAPPSQIQFNLGGGGGTPDSSSSYNDRIRFPGPQSAQQYNKYANMSVPNTPTMMHQHQQQQMQTQATIFQQQQVQQQQLSRNPSITATTITPQLQRFQFNDSNPTPTNSTTPVPSNNSNSNNGNNNNNNNSSSNSLTAEDLATLQPPPSRPDFNGNNTDHGSPTSTISAMSSSDSTNDVGQLMQMQAAGNMFGNAIQPPSSTNNKSAFLFSQDSFNTSTNSLVGAGPGVGGSQGIASPAAVNVNNGGPSPSPLGNKVTTASQTGDVTPNGAAGDDVRFFFYKPPAPHN